MEQDHVDKIIAQWQRERPDLDCSPMGSLAAWPAWDSFYQAK